MNWQERYKKNLLTVTKGIEIFENGFYIIKDGSGELMDNSVGDGFIVKINNVSEDGCDVWFNNSMASGDAYNWTWYRKIVLRPATEKEIQILLSFRPELKENPTG